MTPPKVIIKGRIDRKEFKEPFRQTVAMLESIGIPYQINPAATEEPIDFAIFFQSYPHEFSPTGLKQLRRQNPFALFFFLLGVCCEGMLRTAGPLDSPFYCYAHGWSGRETEQIRQFLTDQPSVFALPMTAENDEIAMWLMPGVHRAAIVRLRNNTQSYDCGSDHGIKLQSPSTCLILTHFGPFGNDSAMNRLLADEQKELGHVPIFSGDTLPDAFSGIIVGDMDDSPREKILESIQRLRRQFADNEFAVYADSPRIDEKIDYLRAGVTQIHPKMR